MRYRIQPLVFANGERNALLLGLDGKPMFDPTVYTQSQVRGAGSTVSTLTHHLEAIKILFLFLDSSKDLEHRLSQRKLFALGELDTLVAICRSHEKDIPRLLTKGDTFKAVRVTSLERFRQKASKTAEMVHPAVTASRLYVIRNYVRWYVFRHIGLSAGSIAEREQLTGVVNEFSTQLCS